MFFWNLLNQESLRASRRDSIVVALRLRSSLNPTLLLPPLVRPSACVRPSRRRQWPWISPRDLLINISGWSCGCHSARGNEASQQLWAVLQSFGPHTASQKPCRLSTIPSIVQNTQFQCGFSSLKLQLSNVLWIRIAAFIRKPISSSIVKAS
jgi:hypothetical protein